MVDACFTYYWCIDERDTEITSIRVYGLDRNNKNVCLRIDDFMPSIYIELPLYTTRNTKIKWENSISSLINKLNDILKEHSPIVNKLVYRHKLYGAHMDSENNKKTFPYLKCSFSNKNDYKNLCYRVKDLNIFGLGIIKLKFHEYDANPILQLVSLLDIPTAGWIKFKGEKVNNEDKVTLCDKEYIVNYKNIAKYEKNTVGKPKIMGFDIEVNSTNPSAMPVATKQGDKIFQISCVFAREGSSEDTYEPYLLSLGDPDPVIVGEKTKILRFSSEADLLEGFTNLVRTENPNIVVGYNILKFDIQYMIDRAKSPWTFNCFNSFSKMGFHKYNLATQEKIKWSSSAFKNQEFDFLNAEGRVFVDLLPLIQRDYKLNNYQLKTVSMEFLKDTKDDLSAKGIFKCYRLGIKKEADGTYGKKARKAMGVCGKYCFPENIKISTVHGNIPIKKLVKNKNLLSWDENSDNIIISEQINFFNNGEHECIELEFEDGRKLECTPDHLIAMQNNEWVEAKNINRGQNVKIGLILPDKEIDTNDMILSRLIGYLVTDGSILKDRCTIYVGTLFDCNLIIDDIEKLTNIKKNIRYGKNCMEIDLPPVLSKKIKNMKGIKIGNRTKNIDCGLPDTSLWNKDCIKEFLGGIFGGDGWSTSLSRKEKKFTTIGLSQSRYHKESLIKFMNIIKILLNKFDIESSIVISKRNELYIGKLTIPIKYLEKFMTTIGYRYCYHKTIRSSCSLIYFRIRDRVRSYSKKLYEDIIELQKNNKLSIKKAYDISLINNEYSHYMPKYGTIKEWIRNGFPSIRNDKISSTFPKADFFIKNMGAENFFKYKDKFRHTYSMTKQQNFLPTLNLKVVNIKNTTKKIVYDLEVKNTHSFLAEGVVVHNCMKDSVLVLKLMEKLQSWVGLCEMAKTTNISIFDVFTQGQQRKVYSQLYKFCLYNNIVVEKDAYITKENERYVGAHVFPPVPGNYERVLPFDFASLYPSTIIAYNIDYSTIVNDPSVPDEKCNVMEWPEHLACLVNGSIITSNGFGFKIEDMKDNNNLILSHSEKTNLLEYKNQTNFFSQGKKKCIELTFTDGSVLKCTPDHRIMTSDNKWIEAKDILLNRTKIKKGISYPITEFHKYLCDFEVVIGKLKLNMKDIKNIEKFCKFSRILGFLYTDGTISKNRATVFVGDIVDAECIINDIYDICGEKVKYKFNDNGSSKLYYIRIPYSIHNSCIWDICEGYGRRITKDSYLPTFILNKNCPLIIKREFLAGMFGGDGVSPGYSIKTKNYIYSGLTASKIESKLENLNEFFTSIQNILFNDFKIKSYINGPYYKDGKNTFSYILKIDPNSQIRFHENIGYRYCTYKQIRCEILTSYRRLNNIVFDQRQKCLNMIYKLKNKMSWDEAVKISHKIMKHDIIFNEHYSLPSKSRAIDGLRRPRNGNKITFWSDYFPSFEKYIKDLGVYDLFVNNELDEKASSIYGKSQESIDTIPYYLMEVINIRDIGIQETFDLEIDVNHSFVANSTVVHNCIHDPKVIRYNKLTKYIKEQEDELKKLREQRDKKSNKLFKQDYIDKINQKLVDLKPYRDERGEIKKSIPKTVMCEERKYRFLKEPKGVIPTVLQNLLDARKNTRIDIKNNYKLIDEYKNKLKTIDNEDEIENIKKNIRELEDLNKVLDKRQLSYKVSANSMYGIMGVKKGLLPFMAGAMCLVGNSLISYSYGFTRKIKELTHTDSIWSYDNGQVVSNGNGLIYNGKKEVVKITLIDGRTLRCTPDHKIMTSNGWIEAGELLKKHYWDGNKFTTNNNYSKVVVGLELPEDIIGKDEKDWKLLDYTMDTPENREKTLAFSRILGFILADGSISSYIGFNDKKLFSSTVSLGTLIDARIFVNDIKLLTNQEPTICNCEREEIKGNTFCVHIPKILLDKILILEGVPIGKRSHQPYTLPSFLFKNNCPLSVIRDFLGGLFGGDGTSPSLSKAHPSFSPIQLGLTTIEKYKNDMADTMNKLVGLLEKFKLNFWCNKPRLARVRDGMAPKDIGENPRWEYLITTNNCYSLLFAQKIGFRYCSDKNNKLSVAASYQRYSDNVRKQHINIVSKTSEMYDLNNKKISIKNCLINTRKEVYENEIPLHEYCSLSKSTDINNHRSRPHSLKNYKLLQKYFPTAREYTKLVGCEHWFSEDKNSKKVYSMDRTDTVSPCIYLDVIDVRYDGIDDVYDIIDVPNHSFIANGIVVHNCTTYMGRINIEIVAKTIQEKYGGKLVYGDKH
jgi:DNA polymerase elongation subunit (family B)